MCYEIYAISHFIFERQKNRYLASWCCHSGCEKSHFTAGSYYPSFGGGQAGTFNYSKLLTRRIGY
jgi:hypothetical protein